MAFPAIPTEAGGRVLKNNQADTTATRTFPNLSGLTKNAGDLLIAIIVAYQTGTGTNAAFSGWSAGWTEFHDSATATTLAMGMAYKWSDGTETGAITVTQAGAITGHASMMLLSIPGAHATTPPEAGSRASGTGAADPAAFNPAGWDVGDTLWIAVCGNGETSASGTWTGIASAPTNYSGYVDTNTADTSTVGQTELAVAFRQLAAASEDVGTFTEDTSNTRDGVVVIAVRNAPVTLYGATATSLTFTKDVRGQKKTFGQTATSLTFVTDVAGIRSNKVTSVAEISLASHGTPPARTNHSIKIRARTTTGSTGVIKAALYEGSTNRSGDLTSSALTTALANYTLAIPDAAAANITDYSNLSIKLWGYDPAGNALVFEVADIYLELPAVNVPVTRYGATATTLTFSSVTAGTKKTFGQTSTIITFLKDVAAIGVANLFGQIAASFKLIFGQSGSYGAGTYGSGSYGGNAGIPAYRKTFGQTAISLIFDKAVAGFKKTFGQTATVFTFGKDIQGRKTTFGQVSLPVNVEIASAGIRVPNTLYGSTSLSMVFSEDVQGQRTTHGSTSLPVNISIDSAGIRIPFNLFGASSLSMTFSKDVGGQRTTHGQTSLPIDVTIYTDGKRIGDEILGSTSLSMIFSKDVGGQRTTHSQTSLPIDILITTDGKRVPFTRLGATSLPINFSKDVRGQRKTFGQIALPINVVITTDGKRVPFTRLGATSLPISFIKDIRGLKKTFGQVSAQFIFSEFVQGDVVTVNKFGQIVFPIIVDFQTAGIVTYKAILLNQADAIYLGSEPVQAVYVDNQKVWDIGGV